ncbi:hypothetical protein AN958_07841 [Leucoagaricus sp. SymC.cos]|nr:hypothetical protein AN958_07841 [Leucoagaricus sp. SymC.cos]
MNTVNASTGFSGFQLRMGCSPHIIPTIVHDPSENEESPAQVINRLTHAAAEAQDNLLEAKVRQAAAVNRHRQDIFPYMPGDRIMLSTKNCFKEMRHTGGNQIVPKFAPKFDGPFEVLATDEAHSTVTLDMPGTAANKCKVFHTSQVKPYIDPILDENLERDEKRVYVESPEPIQTRTGPEHVIERILNHRRKGGGYEFLVKWRDFPNSEEHNEWKTTSKLQHTVALENYLKRIGLDPSRAALRKESLNP